MIRKGILVVSLLLLPFMAVSAGVANASHNYQHRPNDARSSSDYAANAKARGMGPRIWIGPGTTQKKKMQAPPASRDQRNF